MFFTTALFQTIISSLNLFLFYGVTGSQIIRVINGVDITIPASILSIAIWMREMSVTFRFKGLRHDLPQPEYLPLAEEKMKDRKAQGV